MKIITDHCLGNRDELRVVAIDEPGSGGANHVYAIGVRDGQALADLIFQNGGVKEKGINGITNEAVLAVLIDRLRSFQAGPFSCRENALALTKLEEALHWLHHRTRDRIGRGVEGTETK